MRPIEELQNALEGRFADLSAEIDAPAEEEGWWVLDVQRRDDTPWVVVEWKHDVGFGISTPGGFDFGIKPDELYPDFESALRRIVDLISSNGRTSPPSAEFVADLKVARSIAQVGAEERAEVV